MVVSLRRARDELQVRLLRGAVEGSGVPAASTPLSLPYDASGGGLSGAARAAGCAS